MNILEFQAQIDEVRAELEKHQDRHIFLVEENIEVSEIEERLCNFIDGQEKGTSRLDTLIGYASQPNEGAGFLHDAKAFQTTIFNNTAEMGPLLCSLFGTEIKAKLKKMLKAKKFPDAVPRNEAKIQIDELEKTIHDLGRKEESLICEAEEAGFDIPRRIDCDPKIVLNFKEVEEDVL
jgi:hypothetical protein